MPQLLQETMTSLYKDVHRYVFTTTSTIHFKYLHQHFPYALVLRRVKLRSVSTRNINCSEHYYQVSCVAVIISI
jgi:hypothetical protein